MKGDTGKSDTVKAPGSCLEAMDHQPEEPRGAIGERISRFKQRQKGGAWIESKPSSGTMLHRQFPSNQSSDARTRYREFQGPGPSPHLKPA